MDNRLGVNVFEKRATKEEKNLNRSGDKLVGLDGIRAIACLLVILHHMFQTLNIEMQSAKVKETGAFFIFVANSGTSIFFILSGFLLAYPFWKKYLDNVNFPSIKNYILRRAARIIPGFYIAVVVSVVITLVMGVDTQYLWQRTLAALTFTSGFSYVTFFPSDINGALWSISFEVFCYILLPIFMFFLYKFGKKRAFIKALLYWCGIILMLILVNKLIHIYLTPDDIEKGWQFGNIGGAKYWMPRYNPVGFFAQFSIGIIAAGITTQLFAVKDKLAWIKSKGIFDIISAISLLSAFSLLWNLRYAPEFSFSIQNQPYFFPYFQLLVAITLITATHSNIFGKILDNKFFRYTSRVSFGLYVWHYLIISFVAMKWVSGYRYMGMNDMGKWLQVSLIIMIASYAIATISYYCVEKPVLDWAHNKK